jgi:EVE domain
MSRFWIGVASANHVRRGRGEGFMQLGHGKVAPLKRLQPGDGILYYSPTVEYGIADSLKSFVAIGWVSPGEPYVVDMGDDFRPYRRNVAWADATELPIAPILENLDLTRGKKNWGYQLRFGLVEITENDWNFIYTKMCL